MKIPKLVFLTLIALVSHQFIFAQQYAPDANSSIIKFGIKNLGVTFHGSFSGLDGTIHFDPNALAQSSFNVHVDAKSVNTDNNMRDNHLRKEEYFDVEKYPHLSFVSDKIVAASKGNYTISGKLTIKNVTKNINFTFSATPQGDTYIFKGSFELNRRDYGVGGNSMTLSDNVKVDLTVVGKKK